VPLDQWVPAQGAEAEPWLSFTKARAQLNQGDKGAALETLHAIGLMPDIGPRQRLQAWHALCEAGGQPPASIENNVLGVVVEAGVNGGEDVLAAYADRSGYYYNFSGAGVVWQRPDASMDGLIDAVLEAARRIAPRIGVWQEPRRAAPEEGGARLSILTPLGLKFGEAAIKVLDRDRACL
jgi:hypothetical protein